MAEEPPLAYEYRDKFLILTRDLEEEQEGASVKDLVCKTHFSCSMH